MFVACGKEDSAHERLGRETMFSADTPFLFDWCCCEVMVEGKTIEQDDKTATRGEGLKCSEHWEDEEKLSSGC